MHRARVEILMVEVIEHGSSHMEGMVPLFAKELDALSPLLDSFLHLTHSLPRWAMVSLSMVMVLQVLLLVVVVVEEGIHQ